MAPSQGRRHDAQAEDAGMNGLTAAVVGAVLLGALSTAYDFVWATWIPRHRPVYGLVHGMTLLSAVGAVLGWKAHRVLVGLLGGAIAGLAAAASFYAMAPLLHMAAMFPAWMLLWLMFAALNNVLHAQPPISMEMLVRGGAAAFVSGAAFWMISGIWLEHRPGGPNYLWNFLCWTFAYFPGFAALLLSRAPEASRGRL
jgi:hypothetical protein